MHSSSIQNLLVVDFTASSRCSAEKIDPNGLLKIDFHMVFGVKARFARSRYSFMHSSTVIRSLPSIIAMILCLSVNLALLSRRQLISPSRACAPDQVKVLTWPGDMVKAVLVAYLFHYILKNEETR